MAIVGVALSLVAGALAACEGPPVTGRQVVPDARDAVDAGDANDERRVADAVDASTAGDVLASDDAHPARWAYVPGRVSVLTQRNDNARSGANLRETTLDTANVSLPTFGKLFARAVDDQIYAQPLYVPNVEVAGRGAHNVVLVATVGATLYAFDADYADQSEPLWRQSFVDPAAGVFAVKAADVGPPGYRDFSGNLGIVGTPVVDPATGTLYVVVSTREGGAFRQRLHALDVSTGAERPGSPRAIAASVPGTGQGHDALGNLAFDPSVQGQRPGLLLSRGAVTVAWAAFGDAGPYHGWVMGFDAATLAPVGAWCTTPDGDAGGIWQSGQGLAADEAGDVYGVASNGTFSADRGGRDFADTVLRLRPANGALDVVDWFTPFDQQRLSDEDLDLGSAGVLLISDGLALAGGKDSWLYLLDRAGLGHVRAADDAQIVQKVSLGAGEIHGLPVIWKSDAAAWMYVWAEDDALKAFSFANRAPSAAPVAENRALAAAPRPGAMLALSADGARAGTGILWATHALEGSANQQTRPGVLRAFDAADVTRELWNSAMVPARDDLGNFAKFAPVTVADGKVFVATFSNELGVYGLLAP